MYLYDIFFDEWSEQSCLWPDNAVVDPEIVFAGEIWGKREEERKWGPDEEDEVKKAKGQIFHTLIIHSTQSKSYMLLSSSNCFNRNGRGGKQIMHQTFDITTPKLDLKVIVMFFSDACISRCFEIRWVSIHLGLNRKVLLHARDSNLHFAQERDLQNHLT